ncbi:MAG TPA: aspartyl protease family protein [Mesorhizobium sp.]|uniref:aspartyl protease family protein n=1 Tax=Mesorhizobium sp. TaxID=1871066 RepID=UPI002DDD96F7|nr:aspartyl protease family protein [Mesorhizobium sp.]HEV2501740.1 aspartyl protease family protein [Mesorhizobium sp.]
MTLAGNCQMAQGQTAPPTMQSGQPAAGVAATESEWIELKPAAYPFLIVDAVLDGEILPALIDTGTSHTILDLGVAQRKAMPLRHLGSFDVFGKTVETRGTDFTSFEFGGLRERRETIAVLDLSDLQAQLGTPFAIVVGADVLSAHALQVDWDRNRLRLLPSGASALPAGSKAPLEMTPDGPFETRISINGREFDRAAIDTGADADLIMRNAVLPRLAIASDRMTDRVSQVIGRIQVEGLFRADTVQFAGLHFERVPTSTAESAVSGFPQFDVLVGMGLLERFNFIIDAPAKRMVLSPRETSVPDRPSSTSGVIGNYTAEGLVLLHVMRGSPAAKAGLKVNDRICKVDGQTVDATWQNGVQRAWSVGKPGRKVSLTHCNGHETTLTLKAFY